MIKASDPASADRAFAPMLRACAQTGDWSGFTAHLRSLPPAAVDRELHAMEVLEGFAADEDMQALELLLEYVVQELKGNQNFEFLQVSGGGEGRHG